jgi:hypothetical protein
MKNIYKISMKALFVCFLFGYTTADAQLTVMGVGNYNAGGISDGGIVSMQTSDGIVYKWDEINGLVQIGAISNGYPGAGRALIT